MDRKVPIRSLSDQLSLNETDRERVRRRLSFALSRYSDCLIRLSIEIDVTNYDGGREFRCELEGIVSGRNDPIHITTRGETIEESVTRAADRTARTIERTLMQA